MGNGPCRMGRGEWAVGNGPWGSGPWGSGQWRSGSHRQRSTLGVISSRSPSGGPPMAGRGGNGHGSLAHAWATRGALAAARGGGSEFLTQKSLFLGARKGRFVSHKIVTKVLGPRTDLARSDLALGGPSKLCRKETTLRQRDNFAAKRQLCGRETERQKRGKKSERERKREEAKIFLGKESLGRGRGVQLVGWGGGRGVLPEVTMARARAVTALAAAAALAAVFGVGAELCLAFTKRECKMDSDNLERTTRCNWLPGYGCIPIDRPAPDACAEVLMGKGRRNRCEAVASTTCECSRSRGKCGFCRQAAPSPGPPTPTPGPLPDPPACEWFPGPLTPETALNPLPLPHPAILLSGRSSPPSAGLTRPFPTPPPPRRFACRRKNSKATDAPVFKRLG